MLPDQKFCRSCGASLQVTTNPLVERAPFATPDIRSEIAVKGETHRTNGFMLWGFIAVLVGVAIGVIGKKLIQEDLVTVIGVLISLVGMFLMAYPYFALSDRRRRPRLSSQPEPLAQAPPTKALPKESPIQYVPSITDRTTDLLNSPAAPTPRQREDEKSHS